MASVDIPSVSEQPKEEVDNMDRYAITPKNALSYVMLVVVPILLFVSANYFVDYVLVDTPGRIDNLQREMSERMVSFDSRMDGFDSRMDGFDSQLSSMNGRLDTLENNMSRMESRLNDKIDSEIGEVMTEISELKTLLVNAIESSALRVDSSE